MVKLSPTDVQIHDDRTIVTNLENRLILPFSLRLISAFSLALLAIGAELKNAVGTSSINDCKS